MGWFCALGRHDTADGLEAGQYDQDMEGKAVPSRTGPVRRTGLFWLRLVTVGIGVVAVGATAQLFFANVDICGGSPGWWIAGGFVSPLVFVGLCTWCATIARTGVEQGAWVNAAALLVLLYIPGTAAALLTGGILTNWC